MTSTYVVNEFQVIANIHTIDTYINVVLRPNVSENGKLNIEPTISPAKNNIINHDYNLQNIIKDLRLDLELEHANNDFYDSSCDIVQKINNYLSFL